MIPTRKRVKALPPDDWHVCDLDSWTVKVLNGVDAIFHKQISYCFSLSLHFKTANCLFHTLKSLLVIE